MNSTDDLKLGVTYLGNPNGIPLVITPGWACDHHFLKPLAKLFPDFKVMLVDMPGYGKSKELSKFSISTKQSANLLLNTIPNNCYLMSWSLSTLVAIRAIANDKDHRISKFVSICGTPKFPCDPNWPGIDYKYVVKAQRLFDGQRNNRSIKLFFKMQTQSGLLTKEQGCELMEAYDKMGEIDTEVLQNGIYKMSYSDHREAFNSIKIPCLHIFGQKDHLVKSILANKIINPPYHLCAVLQNSGHMPFYTEPDELKKIINLFIFN